MTLNQFDEDYLNDRTKSIGKRTEQTFSSPNDRPLFLRLDFLAENFEPIDEAGVEVNG